MPQVIGLAILSATGATAAGSGIAGLGTLAGTTIGGVSLATVVGTAAILGTTIGLQAALNSPSLPQGQDGSRAIKQAIPPRIRGYGVNRLAGYYMLYEAGGAPPANSYDVIAFHSGRIDSITGIFLNDDSVAVSPPTIVPSTLLTVLGTFSDGRYGGGHIEMELAFGAASQAAAASFISDPRINQIWTNAHVGDGIAWAALSCGGVSDPKTYTTVYPQGKPELSLVARCSPVWDPRDPAQHSNDPSTWRYSVNPVIHAIDYLTRVDGGMGLDLDIILPPAKLALWLIEAGLCDELVARADGSTEPRYASNGWFQFDNAPSDVLGGILSTCDGWLAESGDGTLDIMVGVYRTPTDPPLTEKHITGFALNYGQADEQTINVLNVSFTDPASNFVDVATDDWRDEDSISLTGIERPQQLDLKWVQSYSQAARLAGRAMQRLNPQMSGTFTTTLYGLRYLGKRWVPLQYPFVSGLQNSVVEIQNADVDLQAGKIDWTFNLINTGAIEAYNPATDQGAPPVVPPSNNNSPYLREDGTGLLREDGTAYIRESA
ncbi:MAG: hypothetical protein JWP25_7273 [Bradyrhizobium sp.]|nr:hypothetical protein [Bradyrhizobium sp.]